MKLKLEQIDHLATTAYAIAEARNTIKEEVNRIERLKKTMEESQAVIAAKQSSINQNIKELKKYEIYIEE